VGRKHQGRAGALIVLAVTLSGVLAACGRAGSSAAAGTVVCGTTLSSAGDAVVVDATKPPPLRVVQRLTSGGVLIVQVADCAHGDDLVIDPGFAAHITRTAASKDGHTAAVVLQPAPNASFHVHGKGSNEFDLPVALRPAGFQLPVVETPAP
jgi:hypothetical protein